jgi:hypothetical protein
MSKRIWVTTGALGVVVVGAGISYALSDDRSDIPLDTLIVESDLATPNGEAAFEGEQGRLGALLDQAPTVDPAQVTAPTAPTPLVVVSAPEPAPVAPEPAVVVPSAQLSADSGYTAPSAVSVDSAG